MMDARRRETRLQCGLRAVAVAGRSERRRIAAVRRHGEEGSRGLTLERPEDLHLVADLLASLEVERHQTFRDDCSRLHHVRGERDAVPIDRRHRVDLIWSGCQPCLRRSWFTTSCVSVPASPSWTTWI